MFQCDQLIPGQALLADGGDGKVYLVRVTDDGGIAWGHEGICKLNANEHINIPTRALKISTTVIEKDEIDLSFIISAFNPQFAHFDKNKLNISSIEPLDKCILSAIREYVQTEEVA